MNTEEFNDIVNVRCQSIKEILTIKAKEYMRNDNPFHNFETGSQISNQSQFRVLDGFLLKHIISYRDMLNDIEQGKLPSEELVNEKFGDIINYFVLQEAQIKNLILDEK